MHNSSDLPAGDHGDPGNIVDPGDGGGVQGHADVSAAHVVHVGAQQEVSHRVHLQRYQPDGTDVHYRRADVFRSRASLSGNDSAGTSAARTDYGGSATGAGEADRDHLEVTHGPLGVDLPGGCSERRARRGAEDRSCGE